LGSIPKTTALFEQIVETATPEQAWWYDTLKRGELPWYTDAAPNTCLKRHLYSRYIEHAKLQGVHHRAIETKLGMFLHKYVGTGLNSSRISWTVNGLNETFEMREWIFQFPSLEECRKTFADQMGQTIDWGHWDGVLRWEHKMGDADKDYTIYAVPAKKGPAK
jgi:hypothetical protein